MIALQKYKEDMRMRTAICSIKRDLNNRIYIATVDGKEIGSFSLKFFTKRAIRKYLKDNFNSKSIN